MSMQNSSSDNDDLITEINVTPFVDVVLVLLILFMLAAPAVYQSVIRVHLPTVTTVSKVKHVTLHFYVSEKGDVYLEKEKISASLVEGVVKKALSLDPVADAMISADQEVSHGVVMATLDAIKKSGIKEVGLGVEEINKSKSKSQ